MTSKRSSIKQSDLVDFGDAAAGHLGLLTDASGALVVKPCSAAECAFYETCAAHHPDFAVLIPTFMGKLTLSSPEQTKALSEGDSANAIGALIQPKDMSPDELLKKSKETAAKAAMHGKKLDTEQAIVLENVAAGFVKPNILDVKLGGRLWDDDAPPAKRARLDKVSSETTSGSLGFRVAGMRIWKDAPLVNEPQDGSTQVDGQSQAKTSTDPAYEVHDKHYGRGLTSANVPGAFEKFFRGNDKDDGRGAKGFSPQRRAVLELCEQYLEPIESVLASKESRMYSASVLLVTEGDDEALAKAFDKMEELQKKEEEGGAPSHETEDDESDDSDADALPKICAVKLIDFAHARWTPGEGPDQNMLRGISSVKHILQQIIESS